MTDFNASASHISMMQRPYGPRIHMDEAAVSAPAGDSAPAPLPESFSSVRDAARFLTAERKQKEEQPAAKPAKEAAAADDNEPDEDAALGAAGEHELSDEDDDAALGEDLEHGETDEGADPEAELPPIKRPKSWGKEDQAEWDALSRSQQERIAAREETREKAIRKAQNDAAETSKAHKAKEEAAEKARTTYEEKAREALNILAREQQRDFADIKTAEDVAKLAQSDPLRYIQWDAHQRQVAAQKDAVDKADADKATRTAEEWKNFRAAENAKAIEHIPALGDKEKAPKVMQKAIAALQDVGFTPNELGAFDKGEKLSLFDHRVQRLLYEATRYRDIQAARSAQVTKPVPAVQRPGVKQPQGNAPSERIKQLTAKAHSTGNLRDYARLLTAERNAKARRA